MANRRVLLLGGVAMLGAAAGVGTGVWRTTVHTRDVEAAQSLFALTLPDAAGTPQPLAQWRGKPLVVNFWAPWCAPCVEEMPDLQRIRESYKDRGVEVIGVGIDTAARIRAFREQHAITLPLLVAGLEGSSVGTQLGNTAGALPFTVLIGPDSRVLERKLGRIRPEELRGWLDRVASAAG